MLIPAKERDRFRKKVYLEKPPKNRWKMGPNGFLIPERIPFRWNLQLFAELDDGLFLIDGENAGATPWEFDSITEDADNDFALDDTNPNNETYAYRASYGGSNDGCYGQIAADDETDVYLRGYVYISSGAELAGAWQTCVLFGMFDGNFWAYMFRLGALSDGANALYNWTYITQGATLNASTDTNFSLGAWHLCELHWKAGVGTGGGQLWIDEDSIDDDFTGNEAGAVDLVEVGNVNANTPADGVLIDYDDFKADNSYIGPYSGAPAAGGILQHSTALAQRRRILGSGSNTGLPIL